MYAPKHLLIVLMVFGLLCGLPSLVLAVKPDPTPPGDHLNITGVAIDFDAETPDYHRGAF